MFLTVHSAAGIAIGQYVQNPILAFCLAFILHYIFDIIPHGDTAIDSKYRNPIHIALAGTIDLIILSIFLLSLLVIKNQLFNLSVFAGILGSIAPDFLQGLYYIYRTKYLTKLQKFHHYWHNLISQRHEMNLYLGIIWQITITIILTAIIL